MSTSLLRVATRGSSTNFFRSNVVVRQQSLAARAGLIAPTLLAVQSSSSFSTSTRLRSEHQEETFEEFTARYEKEFDGVQDVFELQRNLNNAFAYDLVPSPSVIIAALKAARRVNDFPTAVRVFEGATHRGRSAAGIKAKVENNGQYQQYLDELKPLREELGITLKEDLYPEGAAH